MGAQERARAVNEERRIEQRAVSGLRGLQRSTDRDTQETRQQLADESKRAQDAEAQERARAVSEERRIEQRAVSGLRGLQRSTDRDTEETRQQIADESNRAQDREDALRQRINDVDAARIANNIRVYNTIMKERRITDDQIDRAHDRMDSLNQIFNNRLQSLEEESVQRIDDMANGIYLSLEEQGINEMQARQMLEDRIIFLMGKQNASLTDAINTVQEDLRTDLTQAIETAANAREEIITELRGTTDTLENNIRSGLEIARQERQALGKSISDESKRAKLRERSLSKRISRQAEDQENLSNRINIVDTARVEGQIKTNQNIRKSNKQARIEESKLRSQNIKTRQAQEREKRREREKRQKQIQNLAK